MAWRVTWSPHSLSELDEIGVYLEREAPFYAKSVSIIYRVGDGEIEVVTVSRQPPAAADRCEPVASDKRPVDSLSPLLPSRRKAMLALSATAELKTAAAAGPARALEAKTAKTTKKTA